jgi:hypothetical protein
MINIHSVNCTLIINKDTIEHTNIPFPTLRTSKGKCHEKKNGPTMVNDYTRKGINSKIMLKILCNSHRTMCGTVCRYKYCLSSIFFGKLVMVLSYTYLMHSLHTKEMNWNTNECCISWQIILEKRYSLAKSCMTGQAIPL